MDLLDLRKYAVDHRVDIRFGLPVSGHECLISKKGQVRIPGEDKDFRIEDVFDGAENFVIINTAETRHLTREEMAIAISKTTEKQKPSHAADEEE